jgi:hypothetical protein
MAQAYTYLIGQNSVDSQQGSPESVLAFMRFSNRDTYNYAGDELGIREPLVVSNDCIKLSLNRSKQNPLTQLTAVLMGGDVNYSAAVSPGDFVTANILNWPEDAQRVAAKAASGQSINHWSDGFKGIFKVQSVRERNIVAGDGKKFIVYHVHALGFTELNVKHYYNQAISDAFSKESLDISQYAIGDWFKERVKNNSDIQDIIPVLFQALIGEDRTKKDAKIANYGRTHFMLPDGIGKLFGRNMTYVSDLFNYYLGVWAAASPNAESPWIAFNSMFTKKDGNFYYTSNPLQGKKIISYENWNQNTVWSIVQSYLNETLNEMYTTYKVNQEGFIFPSVVLRQKPFTNKHFSFTNTNGSEIPLTNYMEVPRWKIDPSLIMEYDFGKDEAARVNFVQVFTRSVADNGDINSTTQIANKNFVYDQKDILRHGLKPYITTANFDFPDAKTKILHGNMWSQMVGDWLIGGHLKYNGTVRCAGIVEPISVGDNLEFNNVVFHIENIAEDVSIDGEGRKNWSTILTLSFGMSVNSDEFRPVYPEMEHTSSLGKSVEDYKNDQLLPGISDSEDIAGRSNAEKLKDTEEQSFTLNPNFKDSPKADYSKYEEPQPKKVY